MDITPPPLARTDIIMNYGELLTIHQVATLLHISHMTLRRWDKSRRLPAVRLHPRGQRLYKKSDIAEVIKNGLYMPNNSANFRQNSDLEPILSSSQKTFSHDTLSEDSLSGNRKGEGSFTLELKNFGPSFETSEDGKNAWQRAQSIIATFPAHGSLDVDFRDIDPICREWAEEFLCPLYQKYGDRMAFTNITNMRDVGMLEILGLYQRPHVPWSSD